MVRDSNLRIDLDGADPVIEQLRAEIRRKLGRKEIKPGQRLPTVRELALELGVNANVVRRICQELAAEGYLMPKEGQGTFGVGLTEADQSRRDKTFDV